MKASNETLENTRGCAAAVSERHRRTAEANQRRQVERRGGRSGCGRRGGECEQPAELELRASPDRAERDARRHSRAHTLPADVHVAQSTCTRDRMRRCTVWIWSPGRIVSFACEQLDAHRYSDREGHYRAQSSPYQRRWASARASRLHLDASVAQVARAVRITVAIPAPEICNAEYSYECVALARIGTLWVHARDAIVSGERAAIQDACAACRRAHRGIHHPGLFIENTVKVLNYY